MRVQLPKALEFLFEPHRYKVAYGGRGGSKSWGVARALLIQGWKDPLRILCAREFQKSIKDSVHKLLSDQIKELDLEDFYIVQETTIKGKNGTEFFFEGLRHNVNNIKSYEGVDRCWVEEAKNVSKASWDVLIPTIRKAGSEIWVTFNPELETDETYKRFVVTPPHDCIVRKVNWRDNPWFPSVLKDEMETLKARDEDAYLHVWEGSCRLTLDGAIYAKELREATLQGRITKVPYDEAHPVHTFWDLGWSDCTSIWFAQKVGFEYRMVDFYQNRLQKLSHYVQAIQARGYMLGRHYLPHDAASHSLNADSIEKTMQGVFGKQNVVVVPRVTEKVNGLKAAREIFPRCWFDEAKCGDGIQALRHYRYDVDEHGQYSKFPMHDENSHAADAFETFARSIERRTQVETAPMVEFTQYSPESQSVQWMAA